MAVNDGLRFPSDVIKILRVACREGTETKPKKKTSVVSCYNGATGLPLKHYFAAPTFHYVTGTDPVFCLFH